MRTAQNASPVAALPQNRTALRQNFLSRREQQFGVCLRAVKDLIKLVKTYRVTAGLANPLRLAEDIFRLIQPELWHFVLASIQPPAAEDVLQEVQKAVATGMRKFTGSTEPEFWAWCYRIARNKLSDHYRAGAGCRAEQSPRSARARQGPGAGGAAGRAVTPASERTPSSSRAVRTWPPAARVPQTALDSET